MAPLQAPSAPQPGEPPSAGFAGLIKKYRLAVSEIGVALGAITGVIAWERTAHLNIDERWLWIGAVLLFLAIGVHHWVTRPASRIREAGAMDPSWLIDRDREITSWVQHIKQWRLVWLRGQSGSGKSALVRAGLVPALEREGSGFLPVYVDYWPSDWEKGPWEALAREFRRASNEPALLSPEELERELSAFERLQAKRPVLFFDQFDDYQALHSDRFLASNGATISGADLIQRNGFWAAIARLLDAGAVHCVIVSRDDNKYGLYCARLHPALRDTHLDLLPPVAAKTVLDRIVPSGAVDQPQAGWNEFAAQLCRDLGREGTLPVRMALAYRALGSLKGQPIRAGLYHRIGELPGLECLPLTHHIREAASASGCNPEIIRLALASLIDPADPTKTKALSVEEIAAHTGGRSADQQSIGEAMEHLASPSCEIVRKNIEGKFRLDHDYLTHSVRLLLERDGRTARLLEERGERFRTSSIRGKIGALLRPGEWLTVLAAWAPRYVTLGPNRVFFLCSFVRVLFPAATMLALLFSAAYIYQKYVDQTERSLDLVRSLAQQGLGLNAPASDLLADLYDMPWYARLGVLRKALSGSSSNIAGDLQTAWNNHDLPTALFHFDRGERDSAYKVVQQLCAATPSDPTRRDLCITLTAQLSADIPAYLRLLGENGVEDYRGIEIGLRASSEDAIKVLQREIKQASGQPNEGALAAFASRIKTPDQARNLLQQAVAQARTTPAIPPRSVIAALAWGVDPKLSGWREARLQAVRELMKPAAEGACGKALRCSPNADLTLAATLAFANSPIEDQAAAFAAAFVEDCASTTNPFPIVFYQSGQTAATLTSALLHNGRRSCLVQFLSSPTYPPAALPILNEQDRAAVLPLVAATVPWQSYEAASRLGWRAAEADAAFDRLFPRSASGLVYTPSQPVIAAMVTPQKAATLWKEAKFCKQSDFPICTVLRKQIGQDYHESLRSNLLGLEMDGGSELIRYLAAGLSGPERSDVLRTTILQKNPPPAFPVYLADAEEPALAILSAEPDPTAFKAEMKKIWDASSDADKANFLNAGLYTWAAILDDDEVRANRDVFEHALKERQMPYPFVVSERWRALFVRIVPKAANRSRIALDIVLPSSTANVPAIGLARFGLALGAQAGATLPVLAPQDSDAVQVLLSYLTVDDEAEAWTRTKRFDLDVQVRQKVAARLCELHKCGLDMRDSWSLAEFAEQQKLDLSIPRSRAGATPQQK